VAFSTTYGVRLTASSPRTGLVVDQGAGVDGLRLSVEALRLDVQEFGPQRRGAHIGEREPLRVGDVFILQCRRRRLCGLEVEDEAEIELLVAGSPLAGLALMSWRSTSIGASRNCGIRQRSPGRIPASSHTSRTAAARSVRSPAST
jgi:hypothetical protein